MKRQTVVLFVFLISLIAYSWTGFLLVALNGSTVSGTMQFMLLFAFIGALFTAAWANAFEKQ